jgi:hypothetical protein
MLESQEYFSRGVDPYWQFAIRRQFLGFGISERKYIPLIAEFSSPESAQTFSLKFNSEKKFGFCALFKGAKFLSIYADRNAAVNNEADFLNCLGTAKRWEFSAPFESTTTTDAAFNFPVAPDHYASNVENSPSIHSQSLRLSITVVLLHTKNFVRLTLTARRRLKLALKLFGIKEPLVKSRP